MNFIVITSIFPPTEAIKKFSSKKDFTTLVVGDKKSPTDWHQDGVTYLSVAAQEKLKFSVLKNLPYNHYGRKLVAYLYAIEKGAQLIVDTDDDNIPNEEWFFPPFNDSYNLTSPDLGFINIYKHFTDQHIWPRGLPLKKILDPKATLSKDDFQKENVRVGIWQGLADGDPDVDAIYRLVSNKECYFNQVEPIVLNKGTLCPFNSQNTAFVKELFPLLYLPSFVTFRFTDILRGLVAQPIMWLHDYKLGFSKATVVQERNPHDYLKDFVSEIPCYQHPDIIIDIVSRAISGNNSVSDNLYRAYEALFQNKIVEQEELVLLNNWINDLKSIHG